MTRFLIPPAVLLFFVLATVSCKKNVTENEPVSESTPISRERGTPDGEITSKAIGASGGTITSTDGNISIVIPAGAVDSDVTITIQPVTTKLQAGTGVTYRLSPETISFQKDVQISMNYTDADIAGTTENDIYLAYQDNQGTWNRVLNTTIDKNNRKLTATTRHFSDWTIERIFYIVNIDKKTSLQANEEVGLIVFMSDVNNNGEIIARSPVPLKNIDGWFVNGAGSINRPKMEAVRYTAPASIPAATTIAVGVRIKNLVDKRNPDRPGNAGLAIVQIPLQLVPEEFFTWEVDGTSNIALSTDAALMGTTTTLIGTGLQGQVSVWLNAAKPGAYDMGSAVTPDMFSAQVSLSNSTTVIYMGTYYNCNEPTPRYGKGKLNITKYGSIGGFIEGNLTATLYARDRECVNRSKTVTGKFKLRRKL